MLEVWWVKLQNRMHQGCVKVKTGGRAGALKTCSSTGTHTHTLIYKYTQRDTLQRDGQASITRVAPILPLWRWQISRNLSGRGNCFLFKRGLFSLGKSLSSMNIVWTEVNGGLHKLRGGCGSLLPRCQPRVVSPQLSCWLARLEVGLLRAFGLSRSQTADDCRMTSFKWV